MSKQKTQVQAFTLPTGDTDTSASSDLVKKYLFHWPLFVLGIIIFIVGAYFYLQVTKPTYPIVATLEFKGPTSSEGTVINKSGQDAQLDPISTPVIVENEIEVMQSKKLMYKVVNDLQLWVNYQAKIDGKKTDLYKQTPLMFAFIKATGTIDGKGEKIKVTIKDANSFTLVDADNGDKDYAYGSPIKSDFGTWKLTPTANFNAFKGATLDITVNDPDQVADDYQGKVKVELENKDAPFVNLSTSDQVPSRGKDILNELMAQYKEDAMASKNKDAQKAIDFITVRLDSLDRDLDIDEKQIEQFKSSSSMTDIASQSQGFRDISQANIKASNEANLQLSILEGIEKWVDNPRNAGALPPTSAHLEDPSLMALYEKLTVAQLKKADMLATIPETNPMFDAVNQQIVALRKAFKDKISAMKASQVAIKNQIGTFQGTIQAGLKKIPEQDREYTSMKRKQASKEKIYTFLLEKREAISLRYASTVSDSEIVDDAHAGKAKWPKPSIVYALALLFGLAAPVGLLYARESLNERISNRKQIEDAVNVPILGELSYQEDTTPIVVTQGRGKFAIGEQFRVLRTNLSHLHGNSDKGRVTLFTSSIGSEGKSFVSSNLAVTLAYASRKTIILEMDLRKPKISGVFNLSPEHPGISDYLAETAHDIKKLIQPSGIPGLDVLGCGPIQPNPSELLEKDKLDELIATLKETYDDILIDSPPIHLVTDSYIIARTAGAVVYMIRQGHTLKDELEFINDVDNAKRFPKFTLVFNGIKRDQFNYGYGYTNSYYSSYNTYTDKEKETIGSKVRTFVRRF
ncbi:polysaccharide biosynthesis tyrosine autokinase [Mucilaginibacter sp. ZT4R22]|uniref:Polysaccharide biosynthesis tyrosine autokinase n=1 Tax=Mucilaginibacter pankratovii TaxID=2772110 RepID=A0ABR7WRV5_9SPHI|nr:tyrosine-protein kinase [Mucilaginibacter pankratovii]MBD1365040.1 polysaccharide biosynthesis tyrosine autokinase [Mucilaginibacter pankratovii]